MITPADVARMHANAAVNHALSPDDPDFDPLVPDELMYTSQTTTVHLNTVLDEDRIGFHTSGTYADAGGYAVAPDLPRSRAGTIRPLGRHCAESSARHTSYTDSGTGGAGRPCRTHDAGIARYATPVQLAARAGAEHSGSGAPHAQRGTA